MVSTLLGLACFNDNTVAFGMFWAVSVEWQFYLIFPFLLRMLRPTPLKTLSLMLVMCLTMRWLSFVVGVNIRDAAYWTILGRIDQFLIGMVVGLYLRKIPRTPLRWLFLPSVAFVLGSLWQLNRWGGWPATSSSRCLSSGPDLFCPRELPELSGRPAVHEATSCCPPSMS